MDIPIEVLVYLFKYLPHSDRVAASQTCRLWYEAGCDKSFANKQAIYFVKNTLQDDFYPSNIFGPNAMRKFANFAFREIDMSNQMSAFWEENGYDIKYLEFDQCDMQEKVFVNILNYCPNLESLTVSHCRELFMSARLLEDLKPESLKKLKSLNLSMNRYLSDALFHRLVSAAEYLQEINLSDCPVSFHPGLYKKFYPFGINQDGSKSPSESVLTFHYIYKFLDSNSRNIKKLSFNKTLIDGGALKSISELPHLNLTTFNAYECDQLNIAGLLALTLNQLNLTELDIGMCSRVTDKSIISICTNLKNLKSLCVNRCRAITNAGVTELWNLKKLECLDISQCELITGEGIKNGLCRDTNFQLRELNICSLNLEESTIILVSEKLPNLTTLDVNFCFTSVTDTSIQAIFKNLLNLHSLKISHADQVSDAGLTGMGIGKQTFNAAPARSQASSVNNFHKISLRSRAEEEIVNDAKRKQNVRIMCENFLDESERGYSMTLLKNLKSLDVSGCNRITDVSLTYAFNSVQLKYLNLSECQQITHQGLQSLAANCPSIEILELVNCFNTRDEGVEILARKLHRLRHLELRGCNLLTDASLLAIKSECKLLKFLDIQGCRNISPDVANSLSCSIPTLHTLLISKPGPYITDGLKNRMPVPPPLPIFANFRRRIF